MFNFKLKEINKKKSVETQSEKTKTEEMGNLHGWQSEGMTDGSSDMNDKDAAEWNETECEDEQESNLNIDEEDESGFLFADEEQTSEEVREEYFYSENEQQPENYLQDNTEQAGGREPGRRQSDLDFLESARNTLKKLDGIREMLRQLKKQEKKNEKVQIATKQEMEKDAAAALAKKREEATADLDEKIAGFQNRTAQIEQDRLAEKKREMTGRIEKQTAKLAEENKKLKMQLRQLYKENVIPVFCNTRVYYALYFPSGIKDFVVWLILLIVLLILLPFGVYVFLPQKNPVYLGVIYGTVIFIFGGIYLLVNHLTKVRFGAVLIQGRDMFLQMEKNRVGMKKIIKTIEREKDGEVYQLDWYDQKIQEFEKEIEILREERKKALEEFDLYHSGDIKRQVENTFTERFAALDQKKQQIAEEIEKKTKEECELKKVIDNIYASRIDSRYLREGKLRQMEDMIRNGQAPDMESAVLILKAKGK